MAKAKPTKYNANLARKVQELFEHYVKPLNILNHFHKYDSEVLTRRDMENVRACVNNSGDIDGAIMLLERLVVYENWFGCLLSVLRDRDVKLGHVAQKMQTEKDEMESEWPEEECSSPESEQFGRDSGVHKSFHLSRKTNEAGEDLTEDEDMVMIDSACTESDIAAVEDAPGKTEDFVFVNESSECEEEDEDAEVTMTATSEPTENENTERKQLHDSSSAQADQGSQSKLAPDVSDKGHTKTTRRVRKSHKPDHGPQYDFSREDVAAELAQIPGWRPQICEKQIWNILMPYCGDDGRYVLWYWEKKKRPALSVTVGKEIKTFTVHKKPSRGNVGKPAYHYIIKHDVKRGTLPEIVQHHLENGVTNVVNRFHDPILR